MPTRLEPTNWHLIFIRISWALIPLENVAAVHSARRYLKELPRDHVLVKLNFSNAFNSTHRREMPHAVHSRMPEYILNAAPLTISLPFCFSVHTLCSLKTQEGAQQGDPIGPLLMCNTVHPLLSSLQSKLNIGFLDDVTSGGHVDVVASDVAEIIRLGAEIGLLLNISKCKLIAHSDLQLNDALLQSFSRVDIAATTLMGAPLFHSPVLDNTWDQ